MAQMTWIDGHDNVKGFQGSRRTALNVCIEKSMLQQIRRIHKILEHTEASLTSRPAMPECFCRSPLREWLQPDSVYQHYPFEKSTEPCWRVN